jgi:hypothetical protein
VSHAGSVKRVDGKALHFDAARREMVQTAPQR